MPPAEFALTDLELRLHGVRQRGREWAEKHDIVSERGGNGPGSSASMAARNCCMCFLSWSSRLTRVVFWLTVRRPDGGSAAST
jgi:hypothetical protein